MADRKRIKFPGFKILDGYITRKFLGTYVFAIALIIVIVVVFDAVEKMDDFITTKASLKAVALDYYLNFIPYFINQFSGLFTFIAVIFFTSKMAYQTEIIAILSSGVSFRRLMWPYFLSAMLITMLSLSLNLWVIPNANARRVEFERQHLTKNAYIRYERHIYRQVYPGTFAYIRSYNGTTEKASYLAIEKYEGSRMVASLEASDVKFNPDTKHWTAAKYLTRSFDENNVEKLEKKEKLDTMINLDVLELGKLEDIIQTMSIGQLNRFIVEQKAKGSDMVSMFEVERQNRFAYGYLRADGHRRLALLPQGAGRDGPAHRRRYRTLFYLHPRLQVRSRIRQEQHLLLPHPARLAARHILRLHRALPLQESAEIVRHPARK